MSNYVITTAVNGTFEVPDDQINTAQTSLNLIGRGVTNYGQAVAQNEINLMSSFAGPTAPSKPLLGQLWFNSTTQTLMLYSAIGNWTQLAFESDLSAYAKASDLSALRATVTSLSASSAPLSALANYVTINQLYTPSTSNPIVPIQSGGTGLNAIGTPSQMLVVNGMGTGLTYVTPSNFYKRPFLTVSANTTLQASQLGYVINVGAAGITITLPPAVQCVQGTSFIFTLVSVTSGTVTIKANGTDVINSSNNVQANTFTLTAGEEVEFASDGVLKWISTSWSRTTANTPANGDNSNAIATTQFVNNAIGGIINPNFGTVSANMFLAAEGLWSAGTTFTAGYSFTGDGAHDTGMFSPSDGDLHFTSQGNDMVQINSSSGVTVKTALAITGTTTAPTAAVGDSSTKVATTAWVNTAVTNALAAKLPFTPVQQGGGANQGTNKVYLGWDGSRLRLQVDTTDLGGLITSTELSTNVTNLQNNINTKAPASSPYAYTGINQTVYFWDVHANGTIWSGNDIWAFASDERLKENIEPIKDALAKIHMIAGVMYNFTDEAHKLAGFDPKRRHMGFLAGAVEKIAPEIIGPAPFDIDQKTGKSISGKNYKTIQYDKAGPLMVEAIKEVDNKVDALTAKINDMEAKMARMMEYMNRMMGDGK